MRHKPIILTWLAVLVTSVVLAGCDRGSNSQASDSSRYLELLFRFHMSSQTNEQDIVPLFQQAETEPGHAAWTYLLMGMQADHLWPLQSTNLQLIDQVEKTIETNRQISATLDARGQAGDGDKARTDMLEGAGPLRTAKQEQTRAKERCLTAAVLTDPTLRLAWLRMAQLYRDQGRFVMQRRTARKLQELDPTNALPVLIEAMAERALGNDQAMLEAVDRANRMGSVSFYQTQLPEQTGLIYPYNLKYRRLNVAGASVPAGTMERAMLASDLDVALRSNLDTLALTLHDMAIRARDGGQVDRALDLMQAEYLLGLALARSRPPYVEYLRNGITRMRFATEDMRRIHTARGDTDRVAQIAVADDIAHKTWDRISERLTRLGAATGSLDHVPTLLGEYDLATERQAIMTILEEVGLTSDAVDLRLAPRPVLGNNAKGSGTTAP